MTQEHGSTTVRQEPPDIAGRAVTVAGAIVVLVSVVSVGIMALILYARAGHSSPPTTTKPVGNSTIQSPIEQTRIRESARGQELQDKARRQLDQWGWVEPGKVARIPISEATKLLLQDARQGKLIWRDQESKIHAGSGEVAP